MCVVPFSLFCDMETLNVDNTWLKIQYKWTDKWIGDVPLKILYPQLFLCSANKEAYISEVLSPPVGDNDRVWSLSFHRDFNDWELAASYSFFHFIQTRIPREGGCDRLCWDLNGSGKFDTWSFYHKIRNAALSTFPWKGIWKLRFLKGWLFFYVDNSPWSDSNFG